MINLPPAASSPRQLELCLCVPRSTEATRVVTVAAPSSAAVPIAAGQLTLPLDLTSTARPVAAAA